jgi:hypothetical protein
MKHPAVRLITCCGIEADIDTAMVPIIRSLWARGVHTCNGCCQGDIDWPAWIQFPDIGEADKFAKLTFGAWLDECEQHRQAGLPPPDVELDVTRWDWRLWPRFPLMTRGTVTVRFPHALIDDLARLVHNSTGDELNRLPRQPEDVPVYEHAGRTFDQAVTAARCELP